MFGRFVQIGEERLWFARLEIHGFRHKDGPGRCEMTIVPGGEVAVGARHIGQASPLVAESVDHGKYSTLLFHSWARIAASRAKASFSRGKLSPPRDPQKEGP